MAAVATPPRANRHFRGDSAGMNTIPDPRTPSPATAAAPQLSRHGSTDSGHHPDLSMEVATLSTKLINAINHQTNLDDTLQATRQELEAARRRAAELEAAAAENDKTKGLWMRKEVAERAENALKRELADERSKRKVTEVEKKRIESELENLTTALFEEANTMVAAARRETEAAEKRNEQLKQQLRDTETLLASHHEQMQNLKAVVEQMSERGDADTNPTAPSTPGVAPHDKMSRMFDSPNVNQEDVAPDHPLKFTHLIQPVLRNDFEAYTDFQQLLRQAKMAAPPSRTPSGNYGGLAASISSFGRSTPDITTTSNGASNSSSPPAPVGAYPSSNANNSSIPALKESKPYKRALTEDIEPTLRLDAAPGLSWLARRTVLNSMVAGTLIVEPQPPKLNKNFGPIYACALCGEQRKADLYKRKYRFRTSEAEDAQRYPLCDFCLGRVRATCDYVGFLRMCRDGHWRADTDEEVKSAWEEGVRLRERMFWCRIGGGVVPAASTQSKDSPGLPPRKSVSQDSALSANGVPSQDEAPKEDPFQTTRHNRNVSTQAIMEKSEDERIDSAHADLSDDERHAAQVEGQFIREQEERGQAPMLSNVEQLPSEVEAKDHALDATQDHEAPAKVASNPAAYEESQELDSAISPHTKAPMQEEEQAEEDLSKSTERLSITIPGSFE